MATSPPPRRRPGRPAKQIDGTESALTALGAELRRLRHGRNLTLIALGELAGYSWQHLGAVERGQVAPSESVITACDRALVAGGRLLALLPAVVAEQAAVRHGREAVRHGNRRNRSAVTDPATDSVTGPATGLAVDWVRLATAATRRAGISAGTVEELEQITERQRTLYHQLSSAHMLVPVEAHLGLLLSLLEGTQTDRVRRRLSVAAGEAAGFAAWLWFDLGDPHKMALLYRMAGDLLTEAGDPGLWSYVTGYRALTHEAMRLGAEAVRHADAALHQAPKSTTRTTRSWLYAISASACALVDARQHDVPDLLAQARDHLDAADGREPWMYAFDHTALAAHRGQCHLRLGNPAEAINAFNDGLAEMTPEHQRRGAQLAIGLAQAHLEAGAPDTALSNALSALDAFTACGSASGLRRVQHFRDRLGRSRHRATARELDERLRAHLEVLDR